jgi:hypothetical protein
LKDDRVKSLLDEIESRVFDTRLYARDPEIVYYCFKSPRLERHIYIRPSELTEAEQTSLKQAEKILIELAEEVQEETKTTIKTKKEAK